jgi:hypothetical protein
MAHSYQCGTSDGSVSARTTRGVGGPFEGVRCGRERQATPGGSAVGPAVPCPVGAGVRAQVLVPASDSTAVGRQTLHGR